MAAEAQVAANPPPGKEAPSIQGFVDNPADHIGTSL